MKKIILVILVTLITACSNTSNILKGRKYVNDCGYMEESLDFISNKQCIYRQFFNCEMEQPYKNFEIVCSYKIHKNQIVLSNENHIDSLKGKSHIEIPQEQLDKCSYMALYTIDSRNPQSIGIGAPPVHNNGYYIGYLNYINNDKLLIQDSIIYYKKHFIHNNQGYTIETKLFFYNHLPDSIYKTELTKEAIKNTQIPLN
jgi:hypothetical protein